MTSNDYLKWLLLKSPEDYNETGRVFDGLSVIYYNDKSYVYCKIYL